MHDDDDHIDGHAPFVFGDPLRAAPSSAPATWLHAHLDITHGTVGGLVPAHYEQHLVLDPVPSGVDDWWAVQRERIVDLAAILCAHTSTSDVAWFAVWEGHDAGWASVGRELDAIPHVALPARTYHLIAGSVVDVVHLVQPTRRDTWQRPDLWWPEDRGWFVATDVDFWQTYIGADASTIAAIEAIEAHFGDRCRHIGVDDALVADD